MLHDNASSTCKIYKEEAIDAIRFNIKVKKEDINYAFDNVPVEIKLFYSGGEDSLSTTMNKISKNYIARLKKIENKEIAEDE